MAYIYLMTCPGTGLRYVGSTDHPDYRPVKHRYDCFNENGKHYNLKRFKYIRTHNINFDEIIFEIIDEVDESVRLEHETFWVQFFDSIENGQNQVFPKRIQSLSQYYQDNKERFSPRIQKYRQDNKDEISEYSKKHYQRTKEQKEQYAKERIPCEICGKIMRRDSILKHKKSVHYKTITNEKEPCNICGKILGKRYIKNHKESVHK